MPFMDKYLYIHTNTNKLGSVYYVTFYLNKKQQLANNNETNITRE